MNKGFELKEPVTLEPLRQNLETFSNCLFRELADKMLHYVCPVLETCYSSRGASVRYAMMSDVRICVLRAFQQKASRNEREVARELLKCFYFHND